MQNTLSCTTTSITKPTLLRFSTFLSSVNYETYLYLANYIGEKVGIPAIIATGQSAADLTENQVHVAFICGLLYTRMQQQPSCPVEPLVAPVLYGNRYQDKPIYFSDIVVRRDSPYVSLDDLRGSVWAYNEKASHSGWNLVCYSLYERGTFPYHLQNTLRTGSHLQSLQMVLNGKADVTALDSHILDVLLQRDASLSTKLRLIDTMGPSTIPPVVVAKTLSTNLQHKIRKILLNMHHEPQAASRLRLGLIKRFAPISDRHYNDIRKMSAVVEAMDDLTLQ